MCFHNSMSKKAQELAARYGRKSDIVEIYQDILNEQYHVNAFNFPKYPIVTSSEEIQVFNWGLIPAWTKTEKDAKDIRKFTLNARAETIFEKPSFRESIIKRRCIVPSTGYFEWRHEGGKKTPYYIFLKDEPIFSMAGIYESWLDRSTGEVHNTFSILTTDSNLLTGYIHNTKHRMPAILSKVDEERWLNPLLPKEDISSLLIPYEANLMGAYIIQGDFMKKVPTDFSIIQRA
ncbi:SOS response-associated peptidase [Bacteroides reticulotermitis]|uniref:SOS response-associated peptidase n=1 Tax=Bacteroides reticulotermitis TaxID=1133319 RepID=UPI003A852AD5